MMAKKVKDDEDLNYDDDLDEDVEAFEFNLAEPKDARLDARRYIEQLKDEKELERMVNGHHEYDLF